MAPSGANQDPDSRQPTPTASSGSAIPPRASSRRKVLLSPQPSLRTHTIRLAVATAIGLALMFALLMLAVKYAESDWSRKNQRARAHPSQRKNAEKTKTVAAALGWKYELPTAATQRQLDRLAIDPMSRNAWLILARGLSSKTAAPLVISSLRMAMAIDGESAEIRNDLGAAYLRQKRMKNAVEQFGAANQIRPGFAPALYNLALCAISERNLALAIQRLGQYLGQRPDDTTALRLQATLLTQMGRTDDALLLLEKFLKNQSPNEPLFLEAAQLAARLGQTGKALRYLETALNGNPIQTVVRAYQSGIFREIRLSGEGDRLAALMAGKARMAFSSPISEADIQPLREATPDAKVR